MRKLVILKSMNTFEDFSNLTTNFEHFRHFLLFRVRRVRGLGINALDTIEETLISIYLLHVHRLIHWKT